jgi:hypothetical protein
MERVGGGLARVRGRKKAPQNYRIRAAFATVLQPYNKFGKN